MNQKLETIDSTLLAASAPPGFEGPEKILEVDFIKKPNAPTTLPCTLRAIGKDSWDSILEQAKCTILSVKSNEFFDAYVLSESSLFVYETKIYIKTCGTTTLLRCLELLIEESAKVGMQLEWVGYSRKDFLFPDAQEFPHTSFSHEISFTKKICIKPDGGKRLAGGAFVLGDLTSDHWYVYVADHCERAEATALDRNINIMMYDLDPEVRKVFYRDPALSKEEDALRAREASGLKELLGENNVLFDDAIFEPCGYSLNALEGEAFHTVHVTPEDHCCYASFETNIELENYEDLLQKVLGLFKPGRFTVTVFADRAGLNKITCSPTEYRVLKGDAMTFLRKSSSSTSFATDYVCEMANFVSTEYRGPSSSTVSSESAGSIR